MTILFLLIAFSAPHTYADDISHIIEEVFHSSVAIEVEEWHHDSPYKTQYTNKQQYSGTNDYDHSRVITGSGTIIHKKHSRYYVLTNHHVVERAQRILLVLCNGDIHLGHNFRSDEGNDLAIIIFDSTKNIPVADLHYDYQPLVGEEVYSVGNPMGFLFSVTQGVVSAIHKTSFEKKSALYFQTDAVINPGSSGGIVVNAEGKYIGVSTFIITQAYIPFGGYIETGVNFIFSFYNAKKIIDALLHGSSNEHAWIGYTYSPLTFEVITDLAMEDGNAVIIDNIYTSIPRTENALQLGDLVFSVNGTAIEKMPHSKISIILPLISAMQTTDTATLTILRQRKKLTIDIPVHRRPETLQTLSYSVWPGYRASPLPRLLKQNYGLSKQDFAHEIIEVYPHSSADASLLQPNDIIIGIDDQEELSYAEYFSLLHHAYLKKEELTLHIIREGNTRIHITLSPPSNTQHTSRYKQNERKHTSNDIYRDSKNVY
ncbi:serine endoprotease DegS-like [Ylistrum balloti]|uniref:serine endoprotease DegS-like n=1 Tax=Ylistrum balloti TaxID=509963 RepID=UPI002905D40C|nr:serine endoprotease DegS-like [Ylistrum balloti]